MSKLSAIKDPIGLTALLKSLTKYVTEITKLSTENVNLTNISDIVNQTGLLVELLSKTSELTQANISPIKQKLVQAYITSWLKFIVKIQDYDEKINSQSAVSLRNKINTFNREVNGIADSIQKLHNVTIKNVIDDIEQLSKSFVQITGAVALIGASVLGINWLFDDWGKFLEGIGKFTIIASTLVGIALVNTAIQNIISGGDKDKLDDSMSYLLNIVGAVALTGVTILGINWLFNDWNKFLEGIGKFSLIAGLLLGISAVGGVLATMDGENDDIGKSIKYMLGVTGAVTLAALAIFGMNWLFEDWDKFLEGVGKFAIVSGVLLTIASLAGVMVSMDEGGNITKGLLVMGGVVLLMGGLTLVMNKFISMSQSMEENSESVEYALMWSGIFVGGLSALVVGIGALASNPATAFGLLMGVSILAGVEALIFGLSLVMGKFADMSQRMYENHEALEYSMKWSGIFVGGMSTLVAAIGLMATNPLVAAGLVVGVGILGGVELLMYGLTTVMNKTVDLAVQTANHRDEIMEALDFLPIMSRSIIKTVKEVAELTFEGKGFFDKLKSGAKTTIGSMQSIVVFDTGVTLLRSQKRFFDLLIQTANLYRQELSQGDIGTTIKTINDTTKFYIDNTIQTLDGVDMKAIRDAREKVKAI